MGKFFYEKHTIFLYKEDYEKFSNGLNHVLECIETGVFPEPEIVEYPKFEDETDTETEENIY